MRLFYAASALLVVAACTAFGADSGAPSSSEPDAGTTPVEGGSTVTGPDGGDVGGEGGPSESGVTRTPGVQMVRAHPLTFSQEGNNLVQTIDPPTGVGHTLLLAIGIDAMVIPHVTTGTTPWTQVAYSEQEVGISLWTKPSAADTEVEIVLPSEQHMVGQLTEWTGFAASASTNASSGMSSPMSPIIAPAIATTGSTFVFCMTGFDDSKAPAPSSPFIQLLGVASNEISLASSYAVVTDGGAPAAVWDQPGVDWDAITATFPLQ